MGAWLDLAPDEAYYWVWSRHPAFGYLDHPPLVAWLIAAGTSVLGVHPVGVRLGAIACTSIALYLFFATLRAQYSPRRALLATSALAVAPGVFLGGVPATPDAALVLGWVLAVRGLAGLEAGDGRRGRWLVSTGAGIAVACLAKLTGLMLPVLVAGWPLIRRVGWPPSIGKQGDAGEQSKTSRGPGLRWADLPAVLAVAAPFVLPAVAWSLEHHGFPVTYHWQRVAGRAGEGGLENLILFGLAQAALVGPVTLWLALGRVLWMVRRAPARKVVDQWDRLGTGSPRALVAGPRDPAVRLWIWMSLPVVGFFGLAALVTHVEPNWPAPAWPGLVALIPWETLGRRLSRGAIGVSLGSTALAVALLLSPSSWWPGDRAPVARLRGWQHLADAVEAVAGPQEAVIVAYRYQEAAEIDFHLTATGTDRRVTALPGLGRLDQYDLLPPIEVAPGQTVVWVAKAGKASAPPFSGFHRTRGPWTVTRGAGAQPRAYHLYRLEGARSRMTLGSREWAR